MKRSGKIIHIEIIINNDSLKRIGVNDFYLFKGGKMELKETGRIHSPYKTVKESAAAGKAF